MMRDRIQRLGLGPGEVSRRAAARAQGTPVIAALPAYVDYIAVFGQLGLLPGGAGTPVASPTA